MRKAQKKQVEEFVSLLEEAHQEIKNAIRKKNIDLAKNLLEQCWNVANQATIMISALEKEDFITVSVLQEYSETVNQVYIALGQIPIIKAKDAEQILKEAWNAVNTSVKNDISVRKEVVFCPYKASMWDSLESVWKAADEDETCDAYVVPIPYFDKFPDGSFGKMNYEGDQYPSYVPVVDYKAYDFEKRKPDMIFIHNPYDDCNLVTSVHPYFYSKHLKEFTSKLVYIPYFILGETIYSSFCSSSGIIFSDKTIVQSEIARKEFIYYFQQHIKETSLEKSFSEDVIKTKFISAGSPKIDKAVTIKKELYQLPKQWEKIINGRKVVLYNTGVTGILHGNYRELCKIQDVLSCFRDRKDVALWWRPHPLSTQVIMSMRSNLLEKYIQLVEEYKAEGFGIYDDTSDLYRAIAYTDMYYGDDSSLINLYGIQGKPIVVQNIYTKYKLFDKSLCFDDCVYENGEIWFFAKYFNGLFKMEIEFGNIEWLGNVPNEAMAIRFLYSKIFKYEDTLWLIPSAAMELAVYHIKQKKFVKYSMPEREKGVSQLFKYAKQKDNKIYMISEDYQRIGIVDMVSGQIFVEKINLPELRDNNMYKFCRQNIAPEICILKQKIYWAIKNTNMVAEYDISTKKIRIFSIGDNENQYNDIIFDGRYFWLSSYNQIKIVRWDMLKNSIKIIEDYPNDFQYNYGFGKIYYINHYIWLFPARGNRIFQVHPETMELNIIYPQNEEYDIWFAKELEEGKTLTSYRQSGNNHTLLLLDSDGNVLLSKKVLMPENILFDDADIFIRQKKHDCEYSNDYRIYESNEWNLDRILNQFVNEDNILEKQKEAFLRLYSYSDGTAGKAIFDIMMKECIED